MHATFAFMSFHGYGWYLSSTAALLYCSNYTHNIIAWLKITPFFTGPRPAFKPRTCCIVRWTFWGFLAITIPVVILQIYNNFRFFNNINELYTHVRPYESFYRDPPWVFSSLTLLYVISKFYNTSLRRIVRKSPRFGIMLLAIFCSVAFSIMDVLASSLHSLTKTNGVNPYWKFALVFKCLADNILLDDFRSVLQRLASEQLSNAKASEHHQSQLYSIRKAEEFEVTYSRHRPESTQSRSIDGFQPWNKLSQHHSADAVGKVGVAIKELPRLPNRRNRRADGLPSRADERRWFLGDGDSIDHTGNSPSSSTSEKPGESF